MSQVIFRWAGLRLEANPGDRLLDLLDDEMSHGLPLACRGANCAVCRVRVLGGQSALVAPDETERASLVKVGAATNERLACQVAVSANPQRGSEVVLEPI
jgi:ferredoxin